MLNVFSWFNNLSRLLQEHSIKIVKITANVYHVTGPTLPRYGYIIQQLELLATFRLSLHIYSYIYKHVRK